MSFSAYRKSLTAFIFVCCILTVGLVIGKKILPPLPQIEGQGLSFHAGICLSFWKPDKMTFIDEQCISKHT
jgi:hypothetical protein